MEFCTHGTTKAGLRALLFGDKKPTGFWSCSDQDSYFYVWHGETAYKDSCGDDISDLKSEIDQELDCYEENMHALSDYAKHAIYAINQHDPERCPALALAHEAAQFQSLVDGSTDLFILLFEFPKFIDDVRVLNEDDSCENMYAARALYMPDMGTSLLSYLIGGVHIRMNPYVKPLFFAGALGHDLRVGDSEFDPELLLAAKLANKLYYQGGYLDTYELRGELTSNGLLSLEELRALCDAN